MGWFRLEGRGAFHSKVLSAGNEAYGAWCRVGQWSVDQLTDGFVPIAVAHQVASKKIWARLLEAGLMHEADGGYQIHDFADYNPPASVERSRRDAISQARREAGKTGGLRSGEARRAEANAKQNRSKTEANQAKQNAGFASSKTKQTGSTDPDPDPDHVLAKAEPMEVAVDPRTTPARATPPLAAGPIGTVQELGALVNGYPALAAIGQPRLLEALLGVAMSYGLTNGHVVEAVEAFVAKHSGSLTQWSPEEMADRLGRYLAAAKRIGAKWSNGRDAQEALDLFNGLWAKRFGAPRGGDAKDLEHAATVLRLANDAGNQCAKPAKEVLSHIIDQYLDDRSAFVAEANHPLRLLPTRFSSYSLPMAKPAPMVQNQDPAPKRLVSAEDVSAALHGVKDALTTAQARVTRGAP